MFLHLSFCSQEGGLHPGFCIFGGVDRPPLLDTMGYAEWADGAHPTRMHSCWKREYMPIFKGDHFYSFRVRIPSMWTGLQGSGVLAMLRLEVAWSWNIWHRGELTVCTLVYFQHLCIYLHRLSDSKVRTLRFDWKKSHQLLMLAFWVACLDRNVFFNLIFEMAAGIAVKDVLNGDHHYPDIIRVIGIHDAIQSIINSSQIWKYEEKTQNHNSVNFGKFVLKVCLHSTKTNTKPISLTGIPCMQDSHRETSLSQLSNDMIMSMNKPQESGKIALNTGGTWTIGAEQWFNHIECAVGQSCNWLNQRRRRVLCTLDSNGNFTELNFTDWQI